MFNLLKSRRKQAMYGHDFYMPDGQSEDDFDQLLYPDGAYNRRRKSPNQMTDISNTPLNGGSNVDGTDADKGGTQWGGNGLPDDERWDGTGEEDNRMDQQREWDGQFAHHGSEHMMDAPMSTGTALEEGNPDQEPNSPIGLNQIVERKAKQPFLDDHRGRLPGGGNFATPKPLRPRIRKLQSAASPLERALEQIKKGCAR